MDISHIFISYDGRTGLTVGRAIKAALAAEGVGSWLWEEDHPDEYPWAEFAKQIRHSDYVCWVCTEGTKDSEGQAWEIENAFGQGKQRRSWVVATDRIHVPTVFAGYYHYIISVETAHHVVSEWLARRRTGSGVPHVALVDDEAAVMTLADSVSASLELSQITDVAE